MQQPATADYAGKHGEFLLMSFVGKNGRLDWDFFFNFFKHHPGAVYNPEEHAMAISMLNAALDAGIISILSKSAFSVRAWHENGRLEAAGMMITYFREVFEIHFSKRRHAEDFIHALTKMNIFGDGVSFLIMEACHPIMRSLSTN